MKGITFTEISEFQYFFLSASVSSVYFGHSFIWSNIFVGIPLCLVAGVSFAVQTKSNPGTFVFKMGLSVTILQKKVLRYPLIITIHLVMRNFNHSGRKFNWILYHNLLRANALMQILANRV